MGPETRRPLMEAGPPSGGGGAALGWRRGRPPAAHNTSSNIPRTSAELLGLREVLLLPSGPSGRVSASGTMSSNEEDEEEQLSERSIQLHIQESCQEPFLRSAARYQRRWMSSTAHHLVKLKCRVAPPAA